MAVRGGGVWVRRLVRGVLGGGLGGWCPSGTVLVSGGTGVLGGHVARWLAGRGVERLVLVGRRGGGAPGVGGLVAELEGLGVEVVVVACDVSDRGAVAGLVGGFVLSAVVHVAGVVEDGVVGGLSVGGLVGMWGVKVGGACHLDELTRGMGLDAFVVFSSFAGVVGSAGQGGYAAANAGLEAVVARRRVLGLPGVSLGWGPWAGGGMAAGEGVVGRLRRGGVLGLVPELAVGVLGRVGGGGDASVLVADVDWERFGSGFTVARRAPLISGLYSGAADVSGTTAPRSCWAARRPYPRRAGNTAA